MTTRSILVAALLLAPVLGSLAACGDDDAGPSGSPGGTDAGPGDSDADITFGERVGVLVDDVTIAFRDEPGGWVAIEVVNESTEPIAVGGGEEFRDEDQDPRLVVEYFMLLDTSSEDGQADAPQFDHGTYVGPGDRSRVGDARPGEEAIRFCYEVVGPDAMSGASEASTGDDVRLVGSTEDYTRRLACGTLDAGAVRQP